MASAMAARYDDVAARIEREVGLARALGTGRGDDGARIARECADGEIMLAAIARLDSEKDARGVTKLPGAAWARGFAVDAAGQLVRVPVEDGFAMACWSAVLAIGGGVGVHLGFGVAERSWYAGLLGVGMILALAGGAVGLWRVIAAARTLERPCLADLDEVERMAVLDSAASWLEVRAEREAERARQRASTARRVEGLLARSVG